MFNDVTTEMVAQAFSAWYYYTGQREKNSPQKQNTTTKPLQGKTCEGFSIARKYVSIGEVRGMPRKTLKPCKYPGCPNLTDSQFCPEHRKKADRDYNRFYRDPAHKERYHTAAWHTIRAVQLVRYPLCEMCMACQSNAGASSCAAGGRWHECAREPVQPLCIPSYCAAQQNAVRCWWERCSRMKVLNSFD